MMTQMEINASSQRDFEELFASHQLMPTIKHEFITAGFVSRIEKAGLPVTFGLDLLAQMFLHRQANLGTIVGILRKHFIGDLNPSQTAADHVLIAAEHDLVDWNGSKLVMKWNITGEILKRLEMFQYPLPMVEEPNEVKNNRQTGYQTIPGSLILKDNHHDEDICLDHINRVNRIPLRLNADVVAFVQNRWKNLDKPKPGETTQEFNERKKAFRKYDANSRDVLAAILGQGDRFWMTHRYDKRGRTYAQGYHVNYQGNDWNKACVEFADPEVLNNE